VKMISLIFTATLLLSANAFLQPRFSNNVMSTKVITRQGTFLTAIKPDLFSGRLLYGRYEILLRFKRLNVTT
jgi:hypothetical protein